MNYCKSIILDHILIDSCSNLVSLWQLKDYRKSLHQMLSFSPSEDEVLKRNKQLKGKDDFVSDMMTTLPAVLGAAGLCRSSANGSR